MRLLIEEALNFAERLIKKGDIPSLVIEAPTSYGKTTGVLHFYRIFKEHSFAESFIHILPLRSIIRSFFLCNVLQAVGVKVEGCKREPHPDVLSAVKALGLKEEDVAYQMSTIIMGRKSPLYDAKFVVSTADSFFFNLARLPVTEIFKSVKHYAIPRARLFISGFFFDEAHMLSPEGAMDISHESFYALFLAAIELLSLAKCPLVIGSATLSNQIKNHIKEFLSQTFLFRIGSKEEARDTRIKGREIVVWDEEFEELARSIQWKTNVIEEGSVVEKAVELAESGLKVLIVRNRVSWAINTAERISEKGLEPVLIHGRLSHEDRELAEDMLEDADIIVATSVIEAGVDINADALITDVVAPNALVQRAGRLCRRADKNEGIIFVIKSERTCDEMALAILDFIVENQSKGKEIDWRLPYDIKGRVSFAKMLKKIPEIKIPRRKIDVLKSIIYPLVISRNMLYKPEFLELFRAFSLVEVYVGEDEPNDFSEAYSESVTTNISVLSRIKNLKEKLAGILICYEKQCHTLRDDKLIEHISYITLNKPTAKRFIDFQRKVYETARKLGLATGGTIFLWLKNVYKKGIGLV